MIPANFDRVQGIGKGNLVYTCEPQQSFHQGLAAVAIGDLWGFIDKGGKIVIKPQFDAVGDFSEGLACASNINLSTNHRRKDLRKAVVNLSPACFHILDEVIWQERIMRLYVMHLIDKTGIVPE